MRVGICVFSRRKASHAALSCIVDVELAFWVKTPIRSPNAGKSMSSVFILLAGLFECLKPFFSE